MSELKELVAEPFRIKVIEPIKMTTKAQRQKLIAEAGYNVFKLKAEDVYVDCLTDSGTTAMSSNQWAAMMKGDESYAGCKSFFRLEESVKDIMGFKHVQPTHQGRAADYIMAKIFCQPDSYIIGNMHFDSFRGAAEINQAQPVNMVIEKGVNAASGYHPFKGDMDVVKAENFIKEKGVDRVPLIIVTVTCNNNGGQPVSMRSIRETSELAKKYGIPMMIDAARFAENAYFIKQREKGYENKSIREIVREMFSYAEGCVMSCKKDGMVNIGGLFCTNNDEIFTKANQLAIIHEGFITYGGLAGRDLEVLAVGLQEVVDEDYLKYRIEQVQYLGDQLKARGVPVVEPYGGHGVYVDAKRFLPDMHQSKFPAQAMVVALYEEAGVRAVELGTCAFGGATDENGKEVYPELELMRICVSRRVYTNRHMDVIAEGLARVYERRNELTVTDCPMKVLLKHCATSLRGSKNYD